MLTPATPTASAPPLTTDSLTVIVASICSLVFLLVVLMLLAILYRRDPLCCKARHYPETQPYPDGPPQYYSSRQTLVASPYQEQPVESAHDSSAQRPEQLFVVGLPNTYRLPSVELPLPRLPSYESVRKRDRQRYIHMLIAQRFGLYGSTLTDPPPTYEESIRQSVEVNWENLEHVDTNLAAPVHSHLGRDASTPSVCPLGATD